LEGDAVAFHGASQNDDSSMVHLTRLQYNINYKLSLYSLLERIKLIREDII
jgi:hypothetical protein